MINRPVHRLFLRFFDPVLAASLVLLAPLLMLFGRVRLHAPMTHAVQTWLGIGIVQHHYYEPLVKRSDLYHPLSDRRELPGVDLRIGGQLALVAQFDYAEELLALPLEKPSDTEFGYHNGWYEAGDAELFYDFVRFFKPKRIIEVGSGNSSLIAEKAIAANRAEDPNYACEHICIEPFERPWLEKLGIQIVRGRVEQCDPALFEALDENDFLFIDSSHVLRPQGDLCYLYLSILPKLRPGVIVQVHDVFTPRDYLDQWVSQGRLWNEQYVLEAFLSCNRQFRVLAALNLLAHDHRDSLVRACPVLMQEPSFEPGAFWFQRIAERGAQA
jgi:hypothetical protein